MRELLFFFFFFDELGNYFSSVYIYIYIELEFEGPNTITPVQKYILKPSYTLHKGLRLVYK